jgi:hypothetical protein
MSERLKWFKSSYSDSEGASCVEVALAWRKSTYSDGEGGNCVEIAACAQAIHVQDSKLTASPELVLHAPAWVAFIANVASRPGA